jgi:phosphoribosylamine--glycine ligase
VVKASGLAAGKGAVVCATRAEAEAALRSMMDSAQFGDAGHTVVIEAFLEGEELSVFAATNGRDVRLFPAAQDHKRIGEGDTGPNTGGMGAYAPVAIATPALLERVEREVLLPTLRELERRGAPFRGLLYAGIMVHPDGTPNVVEFNCRFGDPETQVVLPLVERGLTALLDAAARGEPLPELQLRGGVALTTVLASAGYPDSSRKGDVITIPTDLPEGVTVYHAGTALKDGILVTAGGRVLTVTALADSIDAAQRISRDVAERIAFDGKQFRRDIGWREVAREKREGRSEKGDSTCIRELPDWVEPPDDSTDIFSLLSSRCLSPCPNSPKSKQWSAGCGSISWVARSPGRAFRTTTCSKGQLAPCWLGACVVARSPTSPAEPSTP